MSDSDFEILQVLLIYADGIAAGLVYGGFLAVGIALVRYGSSGDAGADPTQRAARVCGYILLFVVSVVFWVFPWNFVFAIGTVIFRWHQLSWSDIFPIGTTLLSIGSAIWLGIRAYNEAYRNSDEVIALA
jgi:hypothetical protein